MSDSNDMESLIGTLTEDLQPVKCMGHPCRRMIPLLVIAVFYVAFVAYVIGLRHDVMTKPSEPMFLFELLLCLSIAISAALASAWLSVPDCMGKKWIVAVPITLVGVLLAFVGAQMYVYGFHPGKFTYIHCVHDGVMMAFVPTVAIVMLTKQGATTHPHLLMLMNIFAVASLAYVGLRCTCSADHVEHIMIYHVVPFVLGGSILGLLARRLYAW